MRQNQAVEIKLNLMFLFSHFLAVNYASNNDELDTIWIMNTQLMSMAS